MIAERKARKRCPFCGGAGALTQSSSDLCFLWIECQFCGVDGPHSNVDADEHAGATDYTLFRLARAEAWRLWNDRSASRWKKLERSARETALPHSIARGTSFPEPSPRIKDGYVVVRDIESGDKAFAYGLAAEAPVGAPIISTHDTKEDAASAAFQYRRRAVGH